MSQKKEAYKCTHCENIYFDRQDAEGCHGEVAIVHLDTLGDRTKYIGGTDLAKILGVSKYGGAYSVWLEKTGRTQGKKQTAPMKRGKDLEEYVRELYQKEQGITTSGPARLVHPVHTWLVGNLDDCTADRVVEYKTVSRWSRKDWDNGVPIDYLLQVQHYMELSALPSADVVACYGWDEIEIFQVAYDKDLIRKAHAVAKQFWETNVLGGIEPEPDGSEEASKEIRANFHPNKFEPVELRQEFAPLMASVVQLGETIDRAESEREKLNQRIQLEMSRLGTGVATCGPYKATFSRTPRTTTHYKAYWESDPPNEDVARMFQSTVDQTRFKITVKK